MDVLAKLDEELQLIVSLSARVKKREIADRERLDQQIAATRSRMGELQAAAQRSLTQSRAAHDAIEVLTKAVDAFGHEVTDTARALQQDVEQKTSQLDSDASAVHGALTEASGKVDTQDKTYAPLAAQLDAHYLAAIEKARRLVAQVVEQQKRVTEVVASVGADAGSGRALLVQAVEEAQAAMVDFHARMREHTDQTVPKGYSTLTDFIKSEFEPNALRLLARFRDAETGAIGQWQTASLGESSRFGDFSRQAFGALMPVETTDLPTTSNEVYDKTTTPAVAGVREASATMLQVATVDSNQAGELKRFMPAIKAIHEGLQTLNRL